MEVKASRIREWRAVIAEVLREPLSPELRSQLKETDADMAQAIGLRHSEAKPTNPTKREIQGTKPRFATH